MQRAGMLPALRQTPVTNLRRDKLIARALLATDADFATDEKKAREALRAQFPRRETITDEDFIGLMREVLEDKGKVPCTLVVLDEIQLYIGDSPQRSLDVQMVAEALCKQSRGTAVS